MSDRMLADKSRLQPGAGSNVGRPSRLHPVQGQDVGRPSCLHPVPGQMSADHRVCTRCRARCRPTIASVPGAGPRCRPTIASVPGAGPRCRPTIASVPGAGPRCRPTIASVPGAGPDAGRQFKPSLVSYCYSRECGLAWQPSCGMKCRRRLLGELSRPPAVREPRFRVPARAGEWSSCLDRTGRLQNGGRFYVCM